MPNYSCDAKLGGFTGGRHIILGELPDNPTAEDITALLKNCIEGIKANHLMARSLKDYRLGASAIKRRTKAVRDDINNKIVENRAFEVVNFHKGNILGTPIQYVSGTRADNEPDDEKSRSDGLTTLNRWNKILGKSSQDVDLLEDMLDTGHAFRAIDAKGTITPYRIRRIAPDVGFVIYDIDDPEIAICCGTRNIHVDNSHGAKKTSITWQIWTERKVFTLKLSEPETLDNADIEELGNALGILPIIEYSLNKDRFSVIESVYDLLEAQNMIRSNRLDGLEQNIQSILFGVNLKLPLDDDGKPQKIENNGMVLAQSSDGGKPELHILTTDLVQNDIQVLQEDNLRAIYEIASVATRETRSGGSQTGSAALIRNGFPATETFALSTTQRWIKSEYAVIQGIIKISDSREGFSLGNLAADDIDIVFTRNHTDNLMTKAQSAKMLLDCGYSPEEVTEICGIWGDPKEVYDKSEEYHRETDTTWSLPQSAPNPTTITPKEETSNDPEPVQEPEPPAGEEP